jgi:hypothetical protein
MAGGGKRRRIEPDCCACAGIGIENGLGGLGVEHGGRGLAGGVGDALVGHDLLRVARLLHRRQRIGHQVGGKTDEEKEEYPQRHRCQHTANRVKSEDCPEDPLPRRDPPAPAEDVLRVLWTTFRFWWSRGFMT